MLRINLHETRDTLSNAQRVLISTHVQPDGDAIGSLLGVGALLRKMGKETLLICQDPVPQNLRFLPHWEEIRRPDAAEGRVFDLGVSIDASDLARIGSAGAGFSACPRTLVIDHHASNTLFGQKNYVDSFVAASGNLVYRLFGPAGLEIDREAALCIYSAISTDTGNFCFGQMDEEFFLQMAGLMRSGLNITNAARSLHLMKSPSFTRLLGRALSSLAFSEDGRLSMMRLELNDFEELQAAREYADGIVNHGLNIQGVEICFLATGEMDGSIKFSLRALTPHDVSAVALEFGGGGHLLAAGCTVNLPMEEAVTAMRERLLSVLNK
jgi:phosphoesterase RecJ-like protein